MFDGLHVKSTLTDNRVKYNFFALIYKLYENTMYPLALPWDSQKEDELNEQ